MRTNRAPYVIFTIGCAALLASHPALALKILDVQVKAEGAGPVDAKSVLAHVSARPGQEFNANAVSRDVKVLKNTDLYSFVSANVETLEDGVILVYRVTPRLRIRRLKIEGADYYSNKKVRDLLELGVGDLVDESTIAIRVEKVLDAYRKKYYPDTSATWNIETVPEKGVADVRITIDEGKRSKVRRIQFPGVHHIKPRSLKKAMSQKTTSMFSWLTGKGTFSADDLESDRLTLKQQFQDLGFLDAEVGEPVIIRKGERDLNIDIPIQEGASYRIGAIEVDGPSLFPMEEVRRTLRLRTGDVASLTAIASGGQSIRDYYGSRGYINTRVNPQLDADPDKGMVDITYRIDEGQLTRIRNIEIRGNMRTKDKVIRRELSIYPGEIFNEVRVRQSERRLRNLGYFSYVASTPTPTDFPDQYDLAFEVEEQRSGQFVIGAGFSSVDDLIGFVELSQGNFDIAGWPRFTGGGQKFKIRLQLGTERRDWQVSFVEPWFLDRRLSLGFDVFQHDRRFLSDDYDQRNTGASVSLTKPLPGPHRLKLTYSLEEIDVTDVDITASDEIKAEEGSRTQSAGSVDLIRDTRDVFFIPTRGNRTVVGVTLAGGPLGGETDLYDLHIQSSQYFPLWFEHVLSLRGRLETVEGFNGADGVPIFDRLFLGGSRTLRGFEFRDVGPKDENGEPIGGGTLAYLTVEYTLPVVEKVRVAGFYDVGMVYEDSYDIDFSDLNSDVGVGVRFDIPGFPLQFDYAWPIEADEFNDRSSGRFNFLIGYQL